MGYSFRPRKCKKCRQEFTPRSTVTKFCDKCKTGKCHRCKISFTFQKETSRNYRGKYCTPKCYLMDRWKGTGRCGFCSRLCKGRFCSKECQTRRHERFRLKRLKEERNSLVKSLGGKCSRCGFSDRRALDIDHVDSSKKEIPPRRIFTLWRRIKDWRNNKGNLRLLCANCHRIITRMAERRIHNEAGLMAGMI